jgi:surfactin synthase thioesterase subunit
MAPEDRRWTWLRPVAPTTRLALLCFPHAGGGATAFRGWELELPRDIAVGAFTPPGREARLFERPADDVHALVDDAAPGIPEGPLPLVLYGHSMGSLVALEAAQRLTEGGRPPALLVVAGHQPPGAPRSGRRRHLLPDPEFVEELRRLNGTSEDVLARPEVLDLLLPVLRADFAAAEQHTPRAEPVLPCPVVVLGGRADPGVPTDGLAGWSTIAAGPCDVRLLPGDHFFVQQSAGALLGLLGRTLRATVA